MSVAALIAAGAVVLAGAPGPATADADAKAGVAGLAAPGPCAEPREAITGVGDPDFSVVGSVAALLSPIDVAGAPAAPPGLAPPVSSQLTRPGPCDGPGTACGRLQPPAQATKPIVPGRPPGKKSD